MFFSALFFFQIIDQITMYKHNILLHYTVFILYKTKIDFNMYQLVIIVFKVGIIYFVF